MSAKVPFFRPDLGQQEIDEVVSVLKSGWLTTGPRVKRFEDEFAVSVGSSHAVALNSCTAALHLAVHALGLQPGDGVLVPTLTFAATAEVVRYEGGIPILVDCDPVTLNMDLADAERKLALLEGGGKLAGLGQPVRVVGIMPVHVGGYMMNVAEIAAFAVRRKLWVVEDAAHAFPAAWRASADHPWQRCGEKTAAVTCFSFYANKTITTGEGGMAVTADEALARRIRLLSLHGLSQDAWERYSGKGSWDYRILAPGYKYNLTDIAAAIGIHQLARAEAMRRTREQLAHELIHRLREIEEVEVPPTDANRVHSWHLFPIKLRLEALAIDRETVMQQLNQEGVASSVHWRPLHLHPYYEQTFGWSAGELPVASAQWKRLISLPLFSAMNGEELTSIVEAVRRICSRAAKSKLAPTA